MKDAYSKQLDFRQGASEVSKRSVQLVHEHCEQACNTAENSSVKSKLTKADFDSGQEVRWCPGCGDYAILASVQKMMPELNIPKENIVFVSGIGCSGRFPYYMNTYGFHTIHGRAPAVATGLKITRPELSVWIVTGDGDALSIGGNHFIHLLRRNLDVTILLLNNRIYGLTKGQYSPTSEQGKITNTSPQGSLDRPLNPISVALAAEATFVARVLDIDAKNLQAVLKAAHAHRGTSFVEIYQNCNIFNDNAFAHLSDRATRADNTLWLEHGKPLVFGKDRDRGIRLNGLQPEVVTLGNGVTENDLLCFNAQEDQSTLAYLLSRMDYPQFPVPFGIFRCVEKPSYEQLFKQRRPEVKQNDKELRKILQGGQSWIVE
jgi:2-oxoglutarate ferredoxin oxidoreductase subunit beta